MESSFDKACEPSQARSADETRYDEVMWGQLRDQCSQRGFRKKESKAVLETRLTTMSVAEVKCKLREVSQDDSERERAPERGVKNSDIRPGILGPLSLDGIRERAPVKGVKGPDNPTQLFGFGWETRAGTREGGEGIGESHTAFGFEPRGW